MPFLDPFVKITAQGNLNDIDIFNYSFHLIGGANVEEAMGLLQANVTVRNAIVEQIQSVHTSTNGSAPYVFLDSVKFAYIGEDGKYLTDAQTANFAPLAGGYTAGGNTTAFTGAAISISGEVPRDPAGRGRYYPPANAVANSSGFYIGTTRQNELAGAHAALLTAVNTLLSNANIPLIVGIVSEKGTGYEQAVTTVRVGSVLDVQRRRKNRAYETYVSSDI